MGCYFDLLSVAQIILTLMQINDFRKSRWMTSILMEKRLWGNEGSSKRFGCRLEWRMSQLFFSLPWTPSLRLCQCNMHLYLLMALSSFRSRPMVSWSILMKCYFYWRKSARKSYWKSVTPIVLTIQVWWSHKVSLQVACKTTIALEASQYSTNIVSLWASLGLYSFCRRFLHTLAWMEAPLSKKWKDKVLSWF